MIRVAQNKPQKIIRDLLKSKDRWDQFDNMVRADREFRHFLIALIDY